MRKLGENLGPVQASGHIHSSLTQPPLRERHTHSTHRRAPLPVPHLAALPSAPCAPQLSASPASPCFAQGSIRSPGRSLRDVAPERQKSAAEQILLLRGHRAVLDLYFLSVILERTEIA